MMDACEYCGREDVVLYAWHADVWCADCATTTGSDLRLADSFDDAPMGRPEHTTYEQPFVWQTPDGSVIRGAVTRR